MVRFNTKALTILDRLVNKRAVNSSGLDWIMMMGINKFESSLVWACCQVWKSCWSAEEKGRGLNHVCHVMRGKGDVCFVILVNVRDEGEIHACWSCEKKW